MLNKIRIQGYKSIKELEMDLKPINILIGSNGVGKSNFISFFKLVNNIYEQRLQNYTMQHQADSILHYGVKHTAKLYGYLEFGRNAYSFSLQPKDNGCLFIAEENSWYGGSAYGQLNIDESQIKISTTYRDNWLREYLQSYKIYHFHDTSKGAPLRSKADVDDNRVLKEDGSNLPAVLYLMQQKSPKVFNRIELVIKSVMPYFERFDLAPQALDNTISLVWNDIEHPDKYFAAKDLSDGSIRFIALATLLLQPTLPKVIIIDEPELGLHPVAIAKLCSMIKSASERGCQIIISTQSADLISHFNACDVITVDRRDGQSVFNRLDNESLQQWLQEYSLGELWTKSIIHGQPSIL